MTEEKPSSTLTEDELTELKKINEERKKRKCKKCGAYGETMMSTDIMHPFNDSGIYACDKHKIEVWEETFGKKHPSKAHDGCIKKESVRKAVKKFICLSEDTDITSQQVAYGIKKELQL